MAKALDDLLRERPGDPERRARFKAEMLEELRRYRLAGAGGADAGRPAADDSVAERERRVAEALHSGEMEGFTVDPETLDDANYYVAGAIDSDELVARVRRRYGLD